MPKDAFEYQRPTDGQTARIMEVRDACKVLRDLLEENVPPGRHLALAITKLEEVSMWANKGIVMQEQS